MKMFFKVNLILVAVSFLLGITAASPAFAYAKSSREANHEIFGRKLRSNQLLPPENYSNWEQQRQHPAAWDGQDWDSSKWPPDMTADSVIRKLFKNRIFERQYMQRGRVPVVELGPVFYKLSDLDRRRTLKLLTDQGGIFGRGYDVVELVDWLTRDIIGVYTPNGMYLH